MRVLTFNCSLEPKWNFIVFYLFFVEIVNAKMMVNDALLNNWREPVEYGVISIMCRQFINFLPLSLYCSFCCFCSALLAPSAFSLKTTDEQIIYDVAKCCVARIHISISSKKWNCGPQLDVNKNSFNDNGMKIDGDASFLLNCSVSPICMKKAFCNVSGSIRLLLFSQEMNFSG